MTVTLIDAGDHFRQLWKEARSDSGLALGWIWPGGHGRLFSDTIEELLVGASVSQPTVIASPRQVTRGDLARLQVGLSQVKRDVFILNAERLVAWDAHLLNLCTTRVGVNLILLCEEDANPDLAAWTTAPAPPSPQMRVSIACEHVQRRVAVHTFGTAMEPSRSAQVFTRLVVSTLQPQTASSRGSLTPSSPVDPVQHRSGRACTNSRAQIQ